MSLWKKKPRHSKVQLDEARDQLVEARKQLARTETQKKKAKEIAKAQRQIQEDGLGHLLESIFATNPRAPGAPKWKY